MTEQATRPDLEARWIQWIRDYVAAAELFIQEEPIPVATEEERELVALKLALFARALTLLQGCLLLIENDRQLDFRIHARGVIEATMYLIALNGDPSFVGLMKDEDWKSRQTRAALHLDDDTFAGTQEVREQLQKFVDQGVQGAKSINISALLKGSDFRRLYRTYRDMSGDASHVSVTSLNRHYIEDPASGLGRLIVHPELGDVDMMMTMSDLAISMSIMTMMIMRIKEKTEVWEKFSDLIKRHKALVASAGLAGARDDKHADDPT